MPGIVDFMRARWPRTTTSPTVCRLTLTVTRASAILTCRIMRVTNSVTASGTVIRWSTSATGITTTTITTADTKQTLVRGGAGTAPAPFVLPPRL